jgi:hypothetical protein
VLVRYDSPGTFVGTVSNWIIEGQQLRYCGIGTGYDDIYIQGNPAEMKFIAYYTQGGQVTAVAR